LAHRPPIDVMKQPADPSAIGKADSLALPDFAEPAGAKTIAMRTDAGILRRWTRKL
jgi:hypothetical protein